MRTLRLGMGFGCLVVALAAMGCDGDDASDGGPGASDGGGGGTDAGDGSDGGAGGTDAGVDGGGGGSDALFCQEVCTMDADCQSGGTDIGFTCVTGRCRTGPAPSGCTGDAQCVASFSGWTEADSDGDFVPDAPCTADGPAAGSDCAAGEVCCFTNSVCLEGGFCAQDSVAVGGCTGLETVMATPIGGGADVSVCAASGASDSVCEDGACRNPCASDDDCFNPYQPSCETSSGRCVCETSPADSCDGNPFGGNVCLTSGNCGCASDTDCGGDGFDQCYDGVCGCSATSACDETATTFDGTTVSCE